MRIHSLQLKNFRSVEDATIRVGEYSVLVGENNAGKSNVIDALRVFYEKDGYKYDRKRDVPKFDTTSDESWIEIAFGLTESEHESLAEKYRLPDRCLRVRKILHTGSSRQSSRRPGIYGFTTDGALADELFYGAKGVQQGKLGDIIYIEDVSRLGEQTKMSGPSPLRDLINEIVKQLVDKSPSFSKLQAQFGEFASTFKSEKTPDGDCLTDVEGKINAGIAPWEASFTLNIEPPSDAAIVKNLVSHEIEDQALGKPLNSDQFGQGFQRHLIYTLIRLAAESHPLPAPKDKKEFSPEMVLLLFEEPEAFLHPMQQQVMCASLRDIGHTDGRQVLVTTHSPDFVSQHIADLTSAIRLCRQNGRTTVGQIHRDELDTILKDNQLINDLLQDTRYQPEEDDLRLDMESVKYALWLNRERCGLLFARHVLLVEGPTERAVLQYLINEGRVRVPRGGVFVMDCMGKWNIHRFMNILTPFNVQHSVLSDLDASVPPHDKIADFIERAKGACTIAVDSFESDFETFLGVEKVRSDRKPQFVMLKLLDGAIVPERVQALIEKVEALLPLEGDFR